VGAGHFVLSVDSRLRVFESGVVGGVFGAKRDVVTGGGENCMMSSFMTGTVHWMLSEEEMGRACSRCGGEDRCIENFGEKYSRPRHKWRDNIKKYLREVSVQQDQQDALFAFSLLRLIVCTCSEHFFADH
jgi:hypothetical protein